MVVARGAGRRRGGSTARLRVPADVAQRLESTGRVARQLRRWIQGRGTGRHSACGPMEGPCERRGCGVGGGSRKTAVQSHRLDARGVHSKRRPVKAPLCMCFPGTIGGTIVSTADTRRPHQAVFVCLRATARRAMSGSGGRRLCPPPKLRPPAPSGSPPTSGRGRCRRGGATRPLEHI